MYFAVWRQSNSASN